MYNKAYLCLLHSSLSKNHDCVFFARGHVHWNYLLTYWKFPMMLIQQAEWFIYRKLMRRQLWSLICPIGDSLTWVLCWHTLQYQMPKKDIFGNTKDVKCKMKTKIKTLAHQSVRNCTSVAKKAKNTVEQRNADFKVASILRYNVIWSIRHNYKYNYRLHQVFYTLPLTQNARQLSTSNVILLANYEL